MNRPIAPLAAFFAVLALAACNNSEPADDGVEPGEVLEGTISDAMIPLAETTSQPPMEDEPDVDDADSGEDSSDEAAGDAEPEAEPAAPAPADDSAVDALEAAE